VGTPKGVERLELERRTIPQPSAVFATLPFPHAPSRAVQYVRINYFSSEASQIVLQAITQGEVLDVDGYVLDLRNNPGASAG